MPTLKTGTSSSSEDYDLIPADEVVAASLADVEMKTQTFTNKETGEPEDSTRLRWSFVVTEAGPWQGRTVTGMTSDSFVAHPNCKAYNWASALLGGHQFAPEEVLDTDDLIGKPCRVIITHNKKPDRTWENVANVLQARNAGQSAMSSPAQTTATDSPF